MVRLVFRPYTQIWRSICTSESLRASTRVSPGFTLFRHSSPSFGSQHVCSHSDRSPEGLRPADCAKLSNHCHFHYAPGFATPVLAHMLDSLVRVSRRGKENHFASLSRNCRQQPESTPLAPFRHSQPSLTDPATAPCPQASREVWRGRHWFPSLPFQQFQVLFNSLFKVLCIFPSRYLYAIGLPPIFSFRWNLPPT